MADGEKAKQRKQPISETGSEIGGRVRRRRLALGGMAQEELGRISGVSRQTIMKLETGRSEMPRIITLELIARALQTTVYWLLTGRDEGDSALEAALRSTAELDDVRVAKVKDYIHLLQLEQQAELVRRGIELSERNGSPADG